MSDVTPVAEPTARYWNDKRLTQFAAFFLALGATVFLAVYPTYSQTTESADGARSTSGQTLIEVNGPWVLALLAVPVLVAALPMFFRGPAWRTTSFVSALLLVGCVIAGIASFGMFFVPAAIAAVVAVVRPEPSPAA